MFFDLFKKKAPPILTPDMLQPIDAPITTVEAKRIFKEWMVRIGHLDNKTRLDKMELSEHVGYLVEEMKNHEQGLKDELADTKAEVMEETKELRSELNDLKKALAQCDDPAKKQGLEEDITDCEKDIAAAERYWAKDVAALEKFKADKREFLVNYINDQVHGTG